MYDIFHLTYIVRAQANFLPFRVRRAGKVTRSGPELRRKPSRGTNINPFTPVEVQGRSRASGVGVVADYQGGNWSSTPLGVKTDIKTQKVC